MSASHNNDNNIWHTDKNYSTLLNKTYRVRKSKSETAAENDLKMLRKQKIDEICQALFEPIIIKKQIREEYLTFASVKALLARNNEKTGLNDLAECVISYEWADFTFSSTSPTITLYVNMCNYLQSIEPKTSEDQILEKHRLQNPGEQRGIHWKLNEKNSIVQKALNEMKVWKHPQVIIKQKNIRPEYVATTNRFKPIKPKPTKETAAEDQFQCNYDIAIDNYTTMNNNNTHDHPTMQYYFIDYSTPVNPQNGVSEGSLYNQQVEKFNTFNQADGQN
ncbi:8002_t:CDS:2 [Ambispora leptoticha]|uniref:8002_t:CDS:1 n=1 Tax=Ambispora leptoticha TaxID=144679 RepID=A0A9N8ZGX0_9GLOM|nr:8002_t:CDS:2 [Ambispora leptoticha]